MKIDYDPELYKKIARLAVNDVVATTNRKGRRKTIRINNITKLTWQELQLLVGDGTDRFTKMVLLYEKYKNNNGLNNGSPDNIYTGERLSINETNEINEYIRIFRENGFTEHFQVNDYITNNDKWDGFPTIRSLNDHEDYKNILGILPKYFEIVCSILNINGANGRSLDKATHY